MSYSHEDIWNAICRLRQKTHNTRKAVNEVDNEAKSQYTRALGEIDRLERRVKILEDGNRDPDARPLPEETQIQILGDFISEEIPDGIALGETVCDAAIRSLKQYRTVLGSIAGETRFSTTVTEGHVYSIAKNALKGEGND